MNYNILDFIKEHHMYVWDEYKQYIRRERLPTIGTQVVTRVSGYGGSAGVTRYVIGRDERYLELGTMPNGTGKYLCAIDEWWRELKIINESE